MKLHTPRLTLRPWHPWDARWLYRYASDERIGPATGWPPHESRAESRMVLKEILAVPETYAIVPRGIHHPVGSIGLHIGENSGLDLPPDEGEIGYWVGVPYWGQGFAPEALAEVVRHAFEDLGLQKVWCGYFEGNEKSRRVQQKCGFALYEVRRDIFWPLLEKNCTECITCLTRENWRSTGKK